MSGAVAFAGDLRFSVIDRARARTSRVPPLGTRVVPGDVALVP
eukprot:COSAG02_NODE_11551_length_1701_cov_1.488764_1_plen_42_part_10